MRKLDSYAALDLYTFLKAKHITNDQGELLDFKSHAYLKKIYRDLTPLQAIAKAVQIGMSTLMNIKAFWLAKYKKMDIIYSLPAASDIKDFVSSKTNRLIANNPIFQEWTADKDSIEQKQVGNNIIYYRGTWTERAALSIPADLYISDETDRSKQDIVTQYKTRLQHSLYRWEWYLSNPSVSGVGVDKYWGDSDQKHWFIKCEKCGYEWYLTMANIMEGSKPYFGCLKCKAELNRRTGRWVAKYADKKTISGYWIPSLIAPLISAQFILDKQKQYSEEQFTNFVLGQPYVGQGNKLTRPMFMQNIHPEINPRDKRMIIGVDTGSGINYVLGNEYGLFYYDKVTNYEPLKKLMREDKNAIMIIDQGGDIIGPRELREMFPNRVFLCFFRADQKNDRLVSWNDDDGTVAADRTKLIQLVIDEFISKRLSLFGSEADWEDVWLEFAGMYRTVEESLSLQIPVFKWNKPGSGRCDYPFAIVYWRIGLDRYSEEHSTFHEASNVSYAQTGLEIRPNQTTSLR